MELYTGPEYVVCKKALERTPIHFLGMSYKAELKAVYDLGMNGLYKLVIIYGPYALYALVCIHDPELSLFFDYGSMLIAIQTPLMAILLDQERIQE